MENSVMGIQETPDFLIPLRHLSRRGFNFFFSFVIFTLNSLHKNISHCVIVLWSWHKKNRMAYERGQLCLMK
jgi:hypothetical protein